MAQELPRDYAGKSSIIDEMYIATADENYVAARFCFKQDLRVDFLWLAVHCVEKYLKAVLLHNGRSSRGYSHNIENLYSNVEPLAPELLPQNLTKPTQYELDYWYNETPELFIQRLYRVGQPDNRYQMYGYVLRMEDLFKFDQIVFAIRRLCRPLESHFLGQPGLGFPDQSFRERIIIDHPSSSNLSSKLEGVASGSRGGFLKQALLDWNFPFAPEGYPHTPIAFATASQNPVLYRRLFEPLAQQDDVAESDRLWQWVKSNIHLPKKERQEIEAERDKLKAERLKT